MNLVKVDFKNRDLVASVAPVLRRIQHNRYANEDMFKAYTKKQTVRDEHGRRLVHRGGKICRRVIDTYRVCWPSVVGYDPRTGEF